MAVVVVDAPSDSAGVAVAAGGAVVVGGGTVGAVAPSNSNGLPGCCSVFCVAGAGFFVTETGAVSDSIPGGRISMGGLLPASAKLVSFGSSREAKNAAAASIFVDGVCSTSFCNVLFQV